MYYNYCHCSLTSSDCISVWRILKARTYTLSYTFWSFSVNVCLCMSLLLLLWLLLSLLLGILDYRVHTTNNATNLSFFSFRKATTHRTAGINGIECICVCVLGTLMAMVAVTRPTTPTILYATSVNVDTPRQRIFYCFEYIKWGVLYIRLHCDIVHTLTVTHNTTTDTAAFAIRTSLAWTVRVHGSTITFVATTTITTTEHQTPIRMYYFELKSQESNEEEKKMAKATATMRWFGCIEIEGLFCSYTPGRATYN